MNFKTISFTIAVIIVTVGGFLLVNSNQLTNEENNSTSTATQAQNCDIYIRQQGSEFQPNRLPQIENRQALKQATIDYHGEDMKGKDGELATVGFNLALLYHEYQAHQCANPNTEFTSDQSRFDRTDGLVTIGLINIEGSAREEFSGEKLAERLQDIGAENVSQYQHLVSGTIPIEKIPHVAKIKAARSFRSPQGTTNSESTGAITE